MPSACNALAFAVDGPTGMSASCVQTDVYIAMPDRLLSSLAFYTLF